MYFRSSYLVQIFTLIILIKIIKSQGCSQGCSQCLFNSSTYQNICQQCESDFTLNSQQNYCIYQKCLNLTYFQEDQSLGNGNCVSICNQTGAVNQNQNTCSKSYQCSIQYVQQSSTSNGQIIQSIYISNITDDIFFVYSNFINAINSQNGAFQRQYTFDSSIFTTYQYRDNIFLFGNNKNSIFTWNPRDNIISKVLEIGKGTLKTVSQIMEVDKQSNILLVTSIDHSNNILFFTQFNITSFQNLPDPSFSISLSDQSNIQLFQNVIIQQSLNYQIMVYNVIQNNDKSLSLIKITPNYLCGLAQGVIQNAIKNSIDSKILVQFQNTSGIYSISSDGLQCNQLFNDLIPFKIMQIGITINKILYNLYFIASNSGNLIIYDYSFNQQLISLQSNSILDFQAIFLNGQQNQFSIFILNNNGSVTSFLYSLNQINTDLVILLQKTQQIPSYILNPQKLLVANSISDSSGQTKILNQVFLTYQNAQIINVIDSSIAGLVIDFQAKIFQNEQKVNKVAYFNISNLIVSCGDDGKIIVWQAVDILQPIFFYQLSNKGQQCIDFLVFQEESLIVQYQNKVDIFNIFNPLDFYSYPILNSDYTKIQSLQDYFFILNGNNILIFKQKETIYFKGTIDLVDPNIKFTNFFVSQNIEIILTTNNNTIINYQFIDQIPIIFQLNPHVSIYSSTNNILSSFMLTQSDPLLGNLLLLNDSNNNIIVLDMQLQQKIIQQNKLGYIQKVYQYDDNKLFLIIKVLNPNDYNQFQYGFAYYDLSTSELLFIGSNTLPVGITQVYQNILQDGSYQYTIIFVNPLGYTSYSAYMVWYKAQNFVTFQQQYFTPGQNQISCQGDLQENYIVVGSQLGEVRVLQLEPKLGPQKVYQSFLLSENVQSIYQSFKIGLYFIITNYQIKCFSIHTDQLIEIISFQSIKTPPDSPCIKNITFSDNLQILIAYTSSELILKNFQEGLSFSKLLNNSSQIQLSLINGLYIDENDKQIYIYGDGFVKTDFLLQKVIKIDPQNTNGLINQCFFTFNSVFCSKNQINILIYQKNNNNLSLFSTITVPNQLIGFQMIIDNDYNYIITYKQQITIYGIQGAYIDTINIGSQINQVLYASQNIVFLTYSNGYVFSRSSYQQLGLFQPIGGNLLGVYYISLFNQLAYFTNLITFGQVFFYDLNTMQSVGSVSNQYSFNAIGRTIQLTFDNDSVMLNYIDSFGNFQDVIYSVSKVTDNQVQILDMRNQIVSQPKGYLLDLDQNTVYIYGNDTVYKMNYNLMTRQMQRIIKKDQNLQFVVLNSQNLYTLYVVDYWNNLFAYLNNQIIFQTRYQYEVLEALSYSQNGSQIVLVCFLNSILVFKDTNYYDTSNAYKTVSTFKYKKLLLNSQGRIVINTFLNEIIDYDFLNDSQLFYVKLNQSDLIQCTQEVQSTDELLWFLFAGTQSGNIYRYDIINKNITFIAFENNPVILFAVIDKNSNDLAAVMYSGSVFEIEFSNFKLKDIQNINLNKQNQTQNAGSQYNQIELLQADFFYNRYFINLKHHKSLGIYSLLDNSFIKFISFPDNEYKKIVQNSSFILLASAAQINAFDNNLNYINRLRRYNRKDRISDIRLLNNNIIIIVFTTRIESAYIDTLQNVINSIEKVQLTNPIIVFIELLISQQFIHLIGVSQTSIFEKYISFGVLSSVNSSQNTQQCISSLKVTENSNTYNQLDYILNQSVNNMKYVLSVLVGNELIQLQFLNNKNIQYSNTFQFYPFDIYMDNFNFVFSQQNIQIIFNQNTSIVTLQNINILSQTIQGGTSLVFQNKQTVIIQNLNIQNVNFTNNEVAQNQINSAFIKIQNCNYVLIQNLTIDKSYFASGHSAFMQLLNINNVIIQNFRIQNSYIDGNLLLLQQNLNVTFQSIEVENCMNSISNLSQINFETINQSSQYSQINQYLFNFIGIQNLQIKNFIAQDNIEILQIYTSRQFQQPSGVLFLDQDSISIHNFTIINNNFPITFNENQQIYLIYIQNSFALIDQIQSSNNQGNIFFEESNTVQISNSSFTLNKGVLGGSLYFSDIQQSVQILNSRFINNTVSSSGGAIMVFNVNYFEIDSKSFLSNNQAQIGGGLRIISSILKTNDQQQKTEVVNCHFENNQGAIYGNNVGRYPSQLQIYLQITQNENKLLGEQKIQNYQQAVPVLIDNLQSGGNIIINMKLLDSENKIFSINVDRYIANNYPITIQDEISQYLIEISQSTQNLSQQSQNNLIAQIKGQSLISAKQFNHTTSSFSFQTLSLSYIPLQSTDSLALKLIINNQYQAMLIPLNLTFRQCIRGEVPIKQFSFIIICQECLPGTYSLLVPDQNSYNIDTQIYECKKCPEFSVSCSQDQIILEAGYWRINEQSDQIIACNQQQPGICNEADQQSKLGCIKGYIGPLCETCDYLGKVWKESYLTEIPIQFQNISQLDSQNLQQTTKYEDNCQNIFKSKFHVKQNKERETLSNTSSLKENDKDNIFDENSKASLIGFQNKFRFSLANSDRVQNKINFSPFNISKGQISVNQEIQFAQNQFNNEKSQCSDIADDFFQFEENRVVQAVNDTQAFKNKYDNKKKQNYDFNKSD
ncbi:hypothetical protein ABPG74_005518 [Tetrahymena malaccensis]